MGSAFELNFSAVRLFYSMIKLSDYWAVGLSIILYFITHIARKKGEGVRKSKIWETLSLFNNDIFLKTSLTVFSDVGYIAFTVATNRLGVFMEDPLPLTSLRGLSLFTNVTVLDIKRITQDDGWVFTGSLWCCRRATISSIKLFHPKTIQ